MGPVMDEIAKRLADGGIDVVRAPGVMDVRIIERSGRLHELTLVRDGATVAAYDREGRFLMRVGDRDGAPAVLARAEE